MKPAKKNKKGKPSRQTTVLQQKQRGTGQNHGQRADTSLRAGALTALAVAVVAAAAVAAVLVEARGRAARRISRGAAARGTTRGATRGAAVRAATTAAAAAAARSRAAVVAAVIAAARNRARGAVTSTGDLGLGVLGLAGRLGGGARGRGGRRGVGLAGVHVGAGALERGQDGALVAVDDGVVGAADVVVGVADAGVGAGRLGGVVAVDGDGLEGCVKVAALLDVGGVPVNLTTGPGNGAGGVAGQAAGPDGQLDAGGRLGERPLVGGGVPVVLAVDGAADLAVDEPLDHVGGPVDFVRVVVVKRVRQGNVARVVVWGA